MTENQNEPFHQSFSLLPIGVASLVQQFEQQRESNPLIGDSKHKDVYIGLAELPVCPVHGEYYILVYGNNAENNLLLSNQG